jgi:hypothetical protein
MPFLALAPMYPYADAGLATAVTSAGGLGQYLSFAKLLSLPFSLCYVLWRHLYLIHLCFQYLSNLDNVLDHASVATGKDNLLA